MSRPVFLDFEAIDCVIREAIEKNSSAWKDIMSLILSTVEKGDRIVLRAEKVFAEYRFNKITEAGLKGHMELLPETFHIDTPRRKLRRFISEN